MSISTLTLALSIFHQHDLRVIDVNKSHTKNYHLYYRLHGKNRVMLVPKDTLDFQKLQKEVAILVNRSNEEQEKLGAQDARE
jgi:hypothetical protein